MLGIVLPFVTALNVINAVTPADIRVAIEIVIDVDVDVVVSPPGVPTPASSPRSADGNTHTE
jgi:hypothetical protein